MYESLYSYVVIFVTSYQIGETQPLRKAQILKVLLQREGEPKSGNSIIINLRIAKTTVSQEPTKCPSH